MNQLAPLIEALGWTLLHFVWQGAAIAALLWVVLRVTMRRAAPQARYATAGAGLVLMLSVVAATLWRQAVTNPAATTWTSTPWVSAGSPSWGLPGEANPTRSSATAPVAQPAPTDPPAPVAGALRLRPSDLISVLPRLFPWLVGLWAFGSGFLSLRLLNGWRLMHWLRLAAQAPVDIAWTTRFDRIRERLRVSRSVRLLSSASAGVPMVIGWLKPAVLVPAAVFAGLPAAHLEAILAHELAHVRRHDYLVNLLQTAVEALLFYHPAVWWVSAQLRTEREHCCDDVASSTCGTAIDYARALAALEEMRGSAPVLGMAATGGSLLGRVRRLLGVGDERVATGAWPVGVFALLVLIAAVPLTLLSVAGEPPASGPGPGPRAQAPADRVTPEALQSSPQSESESARLGNAKDQPYAFTRAKLKDVLGFLAQRAGIKYRALPESQSETDRLITFNIVASPFVVLETVSKAYGVALTLDHDTWHMRLRDDRPSRDEEALQSSPQYETVSARLRSAKDQPYSFTRAGLNEVLRFLAEEAGIYYMGLSESETDTDRLISFNIVASPFVALETVSQAYGVAVTLDHDIWHMRRLEDNQPIEGSDTTLANSIRPLPVIEFRLVADAAGPGTEVLAVPKHWNDGEKSLDLRKSAILGARDVLSATPERNATTGLWEIKLRLTDKGAGKLSKSSKENIGRQIAIVVNNRIISAPMVRSEIGKQVTVSGDLSQVEASELAGAIQKAAATADPAVESTLRVIVFGHENETRLDGSLVTLDELEQRLKQDLLSNPGIVVTLRSEARAQYQRVKEVIEVVTKLGIPQVGLATKPDGQKTPREEPVQPDDRPAKLSPPAPVLQFRLVADAAGPDTEPLTAATEKPGAMLHVYKPAVIDATDVASASPRHNATRGGWDIDLSLTENGANKLLKVTRENIGRRLAIMVNGNTALEALTITEALGKEVVISGNFSQAEAQDLAGSIQTAAAGRPAPTNEIVIVIGRQGVLTLNGESTDASTLLAKLEGLAKPHASVVVLRVHRDVPYKEVVAIVDICRKAGLALRVATEPDKSAAAAGDPPDPVAVPTDPAKPADARKAGISLTVLDATGRQPIRAFRVVAGVKSHVSDGKEVVNWQPHTAHLGRDGGLIWPLDKAYDEMALRIEADGYAPQVFAWIRKAEGPKDLFFQLVQDAGTAGRVLTPNGQAAAGATVALAMVQREAVIEDGKLRHLGEALPDKPGDRWRRPRFVTTDADGRFRLPAENDPTAAVLIVHESGVREMALADFKKSLEVTLQSWGRLEGRVVSGDKPGADQPVSVTIHRDVYGYPGVIAQYEKTRSAADGSFLVERVLPGLLQVSCPILVGPNHPGITEINFPGRTTHVTVQAGATPVLIGGQGRTVKGRLTGRGSWEGVTFHFHPTAPHVGLPGDDELWKAWGEFQKSASGSIFFRNGLKVNADGTFEIPGVLPGDYQIFFSREGESDHVATGKFTVGAEAPGKKPEAQDIGDIKARAAAKER